MMKWIAILAAAAVLSSCGRYDFQPTVSFTVGLVDRDNPSPLTPIGTYPTTSLALNFSSKPGSQAAYVNKIQVVRDVINGVDQPLLNVASDGLNIYIPSGYICPENTYNAPTGTSSKPVFQSCNLTDPVTVPGNANSSSTLLLSLTRGTTPSTTRVVDIVFSGVSATYQPFEVRLSNLLIANAF